MIYKKMLLTFILIAGQSWANPWGKDADLAFFKPREENVCVEKKNSLIAATGDVLIRFHQDVISQADGPRSHFIPSSSQYTREAIYKYGFFKGVMYGCDRLMRENDDVWKYRKVNGDFGTMKYDPVP